MKTQQTPWVLITGAAGGIAYATVQKFRREGWEVVGVDKKPVDAARFEGIHYIQSDISQPHALDEIYQQTRSLTHSLNAVVNSAGVQVTKPLIETTVEEWDQVMEANLRSVFFCTKLTLPFLKEAGEGAIVNISSVHAVATSANIAAYAASKGGLLALTRALAIEFAPYHIRVNAVLPGAVDTPMLRDGLNREHVSGSNIQERLDNLAHKTVNGRIGRPDEIAACVYFLADSTQSSFMTGQALVVDGGATARLSTE